MKKIIFFCLLVIFSASVFGQKYSLVFSVKDSSTAFPRQLPTNSIIFVEDSTSLYFNGRCFYKLIEYAPVGNNLWSTNHIKLCNIADTALYSLNSGLLQGWDTTQILNVIADSNFWKLTGNKLEPKVSTNYINTDSSYYIDNVRVLGIFGWNTYVGQGAFDDATGDYNTSVGYAANSNSSGNVCSFYGFNSGMVNIGDSVIGIGHASAAYNTLSNWTFIGKGDTNNSWINGYTGAGTKRIHLNGTTYIKNVPAATNDTVLFWENGIVKYGIGAATVPDSANNSARLQGVDTTYIFAHKYDTIFIGDSSYVVEENDTLRVKTPKTFKVDNGSLIVKKTGGIITDGVQSNGKIYGEVITNSGVTVDLNVDTVGAFGYYYPSFGIEKGTLGVSTYETSAFGLKVDTAGNYLGTLFSYSKLSPLFAQEKSSYIAVDSNGIEISALILDKQSYFKMKADGFDIRNRNFYLGNLENQYNPIFDTISHFGMSFVKDGWIYRTGIDSIVHNGTTSIYSNLSCTRADMLGQSLISVNDIGIGLFVAQDTGANQIRSSLQMTKDIAIFQTPEAILINSAIANIPSDSASDGTFIPYKINADSGICERMLVDMVITIEGNGGGVDIIANPQIAYPSDTVNYLGQIIELWGTSDANTVKFDDSNGLQLAGGVSFTLGEGDVLVLRYMIINGLGRWREISRSDN